MVGLDIVHYFGTDEIYPTALFVTREAPVHPVVEGNKRYPKKAGNLFAAKKLLLACRLRRDVLDERIIKVFFDGLFDPSPDIIFGGYIKGRHRLIFKKLSQGAAGPVEE